MKRLFAITLLAAAAAATTARAALIAGSDITGPAIAAELKTNPGVVTDFRGTFDGLRDLRSGRADAALIFLKDGEKLPEVTEGKWIAAPVAYQPIYVVVHSANKIGEIDMATLEGFYSDNADIRYDTWECLPGSGLTQGPFTLAPNPGKGLTVSQFRSEVLAGGQFKKTIRFADSDDSAESRAVSSPNCIVILSRPPHTGSLKVLALSDTRSGRTQQAYSPTASNLHSGDYPLRVTLYVIWPKAGKETAKSAVKAILSEKVANILIAKGLAPAPENIRKKFEQSLDS